MERDEGIGHPHVAPVTLFPAGNRGSTHKAKSRIIAGEESSPEKVHKCGAPKLDWHNCIPEPQDDVELFPTAPEEFTHSDKDHVKQNINSNMEKIQPRGTDSTEAASTEPHECIGNECLSLDGPNGGELLKGFVNALASAFVGKGPKDTRNVERAAPTLTATRTASAKTVTTSISVSSIVVTQTATTVVPYHSSPLATLRRRMRRNQ